MTTLRTISEMDNIKGKKVLIRVDYNVPLSNGKIMDDTRIRRSLPTINQLLDMGAYLILMSHLGRPKGVNKPDLSLKPIAEHLSELISRPVKFVESIVGNEVKEAINNLGSDYQVILLENTRFDAREKKNDDDFARELADYADLFVSDAFGTVHRAHASTVGVSKFLPSYAGKLVEEEYVTITNAMENPIKPSIAIIGGAKVSSKLSVIKNFLDIVDHIVIGGGMAYTFLKSMGYEIGNSLLEGNMVDEATRFMELAKEKSVEIILPVDIRIGYTLEKPILENNNAKIVSIDNIPKDVAGYDIGPETEKIIIDKIKQSNTIFWNGPLGVFENELYRNATVNIANAIIDRAVTTIIGGGDTAYAMSFVKRDIPDNIHISTGGGASLELMSGIPLPGIECLKK